MKIEKLSTTGDGIAYLNGKKVFIPLTSPGDKVKIKILSENRKFIKAELLEILEKGKCRIQSPCKYFGKCGGCSLQHISEKCYYDLKEKILQEAVSQAGLDISKIEGIVKIGKKSRRRVFFKVNANGNLCFSERESNDLVAIDSCLIIEESLQQLILPFQNFIKTLSKQTVSEVSLDLADNGVDCIMSLNINPEPKELELFSNFAKENDIIRLNYKYQKQIYPIYIKKTPQLIFGNIRIDLPSGIFLQATKAGQNAITHEVLQAAKNTKNVLDLYAGIGTYTFPIAAQNSKVTAIEGDETMINSIRKNAIANNLSTQIRVEYRDLVNNPIRIEELNKYKYDTIVINPPRNGAKAQSKILAKSNIPIIIMVSCNPTAFSQDAGILAEGGYKLQKAVGIDQFYWSKHLEIVGIFHK